jgi:hypothetical protein
MSTPSPVFILASPRSFTSLVCAMLGQHPEAYGIPEINLLLTDTLADLVTMSQGSRMFLLHGLLRTVAQVYSGEQTLQANQMAHRWITRRLDQSTETIYYELCQRSSPLRLIDKSPAYSKNLTVLNRIRKAFPDAYYLYLVRHPKEQGKSMMKAPQAVATLAASDSLDYSTEPPTIDPQIAWFRRQAKILEFLEMIPARQVMYLRGEDLCSDPRSHLEQLCQWLDFSWNDAIYEQMLHPEDSPYACMGPYGAQWGNNPGFQQSPVFRQSSRKLVPLDGPLPWRRDNQPFKPEVMALAKALGYE